jgi:hypothetical protein
VQGVGDIIEIGRRLADAKQRCGHGNWLPWLEREFGWEETTARRFMTVYDFAGKYGKLQDLNLPVSGLYALAAPSTPEEVRHAVIDRAASGETLTHAQVKAMIEDARKKQDAEHKGELERKAESYERKINSLQEKAEKQYRDRQATSLSHLTKFGCLECVPPSPAPVQISTARASASR